MFNKAFDHHDRRVHAQHRREPDHHAFMHHREGLDVAFVFAHRNAQMIALAAAVSKSLFVKYENTNGDSMHSTNGASLYTMNWNGMNDMNCDGMNKKNSDASTVFRFSVLEVDWTLHPSKTT